MDKYETLGVVGEGSYGLVLRCRHRQSGQLVAVKKFIEADEDAAVRRMALREIRMLKKLRHDNLVSMLEVFRRRRRLYLVLELMDHTLLDELEENSGGLNPQVVRRHGFQVLRALDFCHANNIVHRDVKPENVLVSSLGVVKLCDFGFARLLASPSTAYTEYVATRWYRAPELLVGDAKYGKPVDIWATGCLFAEMLSGDPIFPGESDIDQLFQIIRVMGPLSARHQLLAARNPALRALRRSARGSGAAGGNMSTPNSSSGVGNATRPLARLFPSWTPTALDFVALCLRMDPGERPPAQRLLDHAFFTHDGFPERFLPELRAKVMQEAAANPLMQEIYAAREAKEHKKATTAAAVAAAAAATALVFPSAESLIGSSTKSEGEKTRERRSEDHRMQEWIEEGDKEEQQNTEDGRRSREHRMEDYSQEILHHWTDNHGALDHTTDVQPEEQRIDEELHPEHREAEIGTVDDESNSMPPIEEHLSIITAEGESIRSTTQSQMDFHPPHVVFPTNQTLSIQIHDFQPFHHEITHRQTNQQQLHFSHQHFPLPAPLLQQQAPQHIHQQSQTSLVHETIIPTRVTLQIDPASLSGTLLTGRTSSQTQKPSLVLHHSSKKGNISDISSCAPRNQELRLPDVPGASGRRKGQNPTSSVNVGWQLGRS